MKDLDHHFDKIYRHINLTSLAVILYVFAVTFLPIKEENLRFVDIALGMLLGWMISNSSYLTGGNPNAQKKGSTEPGTVDLSLTATAKTETDTPNTNTNG